MPVFDRNPDLELKGICALSYLSGGIIGLIYVLFSGRHRNSMFFKFHFYQAMFLGILFLLFGMAYGSIVSIVSGMLGLMGSMTAGIVALIGQGAALIAAIFNWAFYLCNLAGIVQAIRGRYLDIPWISKTVRGRM